MFTELDRCDADIAMLVDKSGSITAREDGGTPANWDILKNFIYSVMDQTQFGSSGVQFAVAFFANNANLFVRLNQCNTTECARRIISKVNPPVGILNSLFIKMDNVI